MDRKKYRDMVTFTPSRIIAIAIRELMDFDYRVPMSLVEEYNSALIEEGKSNENKK